MSPIAPRREGWCPGALRPMQTGDGLLVRVRASGGRLTLDQAAAIAESALACGNGAISLSARGNLQVRGVNEKTMPDLQARLAAACLLDSDPEVERLRNILVSPLSDVDPAAAFDLAPSVAVLESRLAEDSALRPLPAKFSFVLDAGGRLPVGDIDADIRFEAIRGAEGPAFAAYLGGDDALAAILPPSEIGDAASRLAQAFLSRAGAGEARRMRALVERLGAKAVFAGAGLDARPRARSRRSTSLRDVLGGHAFGPAVVVGAGAAFGDIDAGRFRTLIERARSAGADGLRLAPWRSFFVTGLTPRSAVSFLGVCAKVGFLVHSGDLRMRVVACPGAPACMHAFRPLREDAARWASLLPAADSVILHVSGCTKGCARPLATAATLIATENGYDLVVDGRAADRPVRRGLSSVAIEAFLAGEGAKLFESERSGA
ncbi:MAG: precorrin-3B synthase [Hyphomicrobiales bacterium]|nr:precorrin-3B synthase [Hyphomicrobiales bacterium]